MWQPIFGSVLIFHLHNFHYFLYTTRYHHIHYTKLNQLFSVALPKSGSALNAWLHFGRSFVSNRDQLFVRGLKTESNKWLIICPLLCYRATPVTHKLHAYYYFWVWLFLGFHVSYFFFIGMHHFTFQFLYERGVKFMIVKNYIRLHSWQ